MSGVRRTRWMCAAVWVVSLALVTLCLGARSALSDAGIAQQVVQQEVPTTDVAITMVFDISGSMDDVSAYGGMTKLDAACQQSIGFVNGSIRNGGGAGGMSCSVGVCAFSDNSSRVCDLSFDAATVVNALGALSARGSTNIYAGLEEGIRQLESQPGAKIMMFLSDGLSNAGPGRDDILNLAREARQKDITIYTIGYGSQSELDEDLLREIADICGGTYSHEDPSSASAASVGLFASMMEAQLQQTQSVLVSEKGTVGQGQTSSATTFEVNSYGTLTCYLYWPGSMLDLNLIDPDGIAVTQGYAGLTQLTNTIPAKLVIDGAKQGAWKMSVFGREVSMAQEPYYAAAALSVTQQPQVVARGGGAARNSGNGMLILLVVVALGSILGVYAMTLRRR